VCTCACVPLSNAVTLFSLHTSGGRCMKYGYRALAEFTDSGRQKDKKCPGATLSSIKPNKDVLDLNMRLSR
jgi:hypothetical protein